MGQTFTVLPSSIDLTCLKFYRLRETKKMTPILTVKPLLSTCIHTEGFIHACHELKSMMGSKMNEMFIAGPIYNAGDSQIVVTGKPVQNTSNVYRNDALRFAVGATMELSEELGFFISHKDLIRVSSYQKGKKTITTYIAPTDKIRRHTSSDNSFFESYANDQKDDKKNTIQVVVVGPKDDFLKLFESTNERSSTISQKENNDIIGTMIVQLDGIVKTTYFFPSLLMLLFPAVAASIL